MNSTLENNRFKSSEDRMKNNTSRGLTTNKPYEERRGLKSLRCDVTDEEYTGWTDVEVLKTA